MQTNGFSQWYMERFGSCAAVAAHFSNDISLVADSIGVNWSAVSSRVYFQSGTTCRVNANGAAYLKKGNRNSVGIYASLETYDKDRSIEFPSITFKNKGGNGQTEVFFALNYLWELYEREKGLRTSDQVQRWQDEKRKREERVTREQLAARREAEQEAKRKAANVTSELQEFQQLPRAVSFVYTDKKKISSIMEHIDARTGENEHGKYMAMQLHDLNGTPRGIQRIYENKFSRNGGNETDKDFTWGMNKSGAHLVIGDLHSADRIYVVEGFATGASVYIAMNSMDDQPIRCAVIVALDADNMIKVVQEYRRKKPYLDLLLAVDNDMWKCAEGKGNKGMLVAIDLLSEFDELKAYAPKFDTIDPSYKPTDWNDLHRYKGLAAVALQLKRSMARVKIEGDLFEKSLMRIAYIQNREKGPLHEELKKCIVAGMKVGLPAYRPSDVFAMTMARTEKAGIRPNRINKKDLQKKVKSIFHAQMMQAQELRSLSPRITDANQRPDHIEYHKFNKTVIDDEVLNKVRELEGIVIVRFPMGSRKTQGLIKPMMFENYNALFTAHRVSLIGGAVEALNRKTTDGSDLSKIMDGRCIVNYQEPSIKQLMPSVHKLAACVNSILKPEFTPLLDNLDALCIDEAAQTLRHIVVGGAIAYPVAVFERLLGLMANTKSKVIFADADANDLLVEFAELGLKQRNATAKAVYGEDAKLQKIHVIDGVTDCSNISMFYTDSDTAFKRAIDDVKDGHKVMIACDSAETGKRLAIELRSRFPTRKGLFIASKDVLEQSTLADVDAFTDDPDEQSTRYDWVIYSPAISSGVSFEKAHFNKHYGIFCGTVAPSDAIQMLRRDRSAREYIVGVETRRNNREDSAEAIAKGMLLANDNQIKIEPMTELSGFLYKTGHTEFDIIRVKSMAQEAGARNSFAQNLIHSLYADNYNLQKLDSTDIEKEQGKEAKKAAGDLAKAMDLTRHLEQSTPNDDEYADMEQRTNISIEDKARMNRWKIESLLMMPVDECSIKFFKKGGVKKVRLFEMLNLSPEKAAEYDAAELSTDVRSSQRKYVAKNRQALRDFFEVAGFNWKTGAGETTAEQLAAAVEYLIEGDKIHLFNNWFQFGGYINPFSRNIKPINKAKAILEALGLDLVSRQLPRTTDQSSSRMRYSIDSGLWNEMASIHDRRTAENVTAFNVQSLTGEMIQSSPTSFIEEKNNLDHSNAAKTKGFGWLNLIKESVQSLKIPAQFTPKILTEVNKDGLLAGPVPKSGGKELIWQIYKFLR
jgi:putative DNA primase/helicase